MGTKPPDDIYQRTVQALREANGPVSIKALQELLGIPPDKVMAVSQQLIQENKVKISTVEGSSEVHLELSSEKEVVEQKRLKGLEPDERLVHQIIEQSSTTGIWIRDIRVQSNLQNPRLQKVLKALEGRQLIKSVKMHTHSSKKMYMLYHLSPSEELTGGAWYTDGNLDEQLVETMRQFCVRVIEQKGEMSLDAITSLVRSKFTSEQNLSSGHMKQILQTLMYDGLIDEHVGEDDEPIYVNLIMKLPSTSPLSSIPCGQCPVLHECADGNDISPATCEYMNAWLDF